MLSGILTHRLRFQRPLRVHPLGYVAPSYITGRSQPMTAYHLLPKVLGRHSIASNFSPSSLVKQALYTRRELCANVALISLPTLLSSLRYDRTRRRLIS